MDELFGARSPVKMGPEQGSCFTEAQYAEATSAYYLETQRPQDGGGFGEVVREWAIDQEAGLFLFRLARQTRPRVSLEIGLCQGASALHLTAAHAINGAGLHIAIDPFQRSFFQNQGLLSLARFGLNDWFQHIDKRSDAALPLLHAAGLAIDLIFIDGDHRFDAVFSDFYWSDKLLPVGGYLIFDEGGYDCPTMKVNSFIQSNLPQYLRQQSPARLYVYRKTGPDSRDFADQHPF